MSTGSWMSGQHPALGNAGGSEACPRPRARGGRRRPCCVNQTGGGEEEAWCTTGATGGGSSESEVVPSGGGIENGASANSAMPCDRDLTVADENVLECRICFHPLKPPIFQCAVGHALCSSCRSKLRGARRCHLCRVAMPRGYQRCHAMEDVMNSIRGPCPHAPYGCNARPVYHARERHALRCPHAPCHCPAGGDACGFAGPVPALVSHIWAAHGWPCTAEVGAGESFGVYLCDGFNFLTAIRGGTQYLLLLNMVSTPFGHAVSAVWIRSPAAIAAISSSAPAATSRNTTCELELYFMQFEDAQLQRGHHERSRFQVECVCPSNGLPDPSTSFQFFVPKYAGRTGYEGPPVYVIAAISINTS